MTSKQRAYLKSLAMTMDPIFQVGKSSVTPELTKAIEAVSYTHLIIPLQTGKRRCMPRPEGMRGLPLAMSFLCR